MNGRAVRWLQAMAAPLLVGCATSLCAQEQPHHQQHQQHQQTTGDREPVDHAAMGHGTHDPQPREPIPQLTDADRAAAFPAIRAGHAAHDAGTHAFFRVDHLEARDADPGSGFAWEAIGWLGGDIRRAWLRTEGERLDGRTHAAELEILGGRAIAPWWDLVAGVRHDFHPGPSQTFAGVGVIGLAPYKFEIEATAWMGESGQTAARLEAEYELLFTNRLILQPLVELEIFGRTDERRGIGSGVSTIEAGARLRYEFTRRFAPYVGVTYERALAGTADLRRAGGDRTAETMLVAGLRTWF